MSQSNEDKHNLAIYKTLLTLAVPEHNFPEH